MTDELPLTPSRRPRSRDEVVADLFRTEYRSLVGMAHVLVDGDAEEVVQESFTRLYASFRRLDDPARAAAYLRSIVLNQARSRLRRRRSARRARARALTDSTDDHFATRLADPDAQHIRAVVRSLPRRQLECIVLRYYDQATEREIADTLQITPGSVKQHLHRATTTLSERLEDLA